MVDFEVLHSSPGSGLGYMSDVVTMLGYNAVAQFQCSWHSVLWSQGIQILTWKLL